MTIKLRLTAVGVLVAVGAAEHNGGLDHLPFPDGVVQLLTSNSSATASTGGSIAMIDTISGAEHEISWDAEHLIIKVGKGSSEG